VHYKQKARLKNGASSVPDCIVDFKRERKGVMEDQICEYASCEG
jgi:hypothetical protein